MRCAYSERRLSPFRRPSRLPSALRHLQPSRHSHAAAAAVSGRAVALWERLSLRPRAGLTTAQAAIPGKGIGNKRKNRRYEFHRGIIGFPAFERSIYFDLVFDGSKRRILRSSIQ
jgi:hypothetical protein